MTIQAPRTSEVPTPVDMSDNFLQRAVDRLEQRGSTSKIKLFVLIIQEVLSRKKTPNS
jgi:hypothetical protein